MTGNQHALAWTRLTHLVKTLKALVAKDPEQEVTGIAVPVLDAVLEHAKGVIGDDPVVEAAAAVISADVIGLGEPVRALDALIVAEQLLVTLGHPPWPE